MAATRLVANHGKGECVSTSDPFTPSVRPIDIVLMPAKGAPVEKPCPNIADLADAVGVVPTVCVNKAPVVVSTSVIPKSKGAPPDAIKGKASPPPANNACTFVSSSPTVFAGGKPVIRHRDVTSQNAGNCPGAVKLSLAFSLTGTGVRIDPNLTPEEKEMILRDLEELAKTPRGHELLTTMQNPSIMQNHTVVITLVPDPTSLLAGSTALALQDQARFMTFAPGSLTELVPGRGSNTIVTYNPAQATAYGLPGAVLLGHELIHGYHNAMGTVLFGGEQLAGHVSETPFTDIQAIGLDRFASDRFTENALRAERGLPPRLNWDRDGKNKFPYEPEKGSVPAAGAARTDGAGNGLVYAQ